MPFPVTTASAPHTADSRRSGAARRSLSLLHLLVHVGHVEMGDHAGIGEQRRGGVGIVGVDVDLQRRRVADDEHGVSKLLQLVDEPALLEIACR